ncbi:MAG: DEAD/DEAH box helicase family protein [Candidatus Paceibacterota bacterium]
MKIILKDYQQKAVDTLSEKTLIFLKSNSEDKKIIVLQAPTGSGKTIIMASFIESLVGKNKEEDVEDFTFVWLSIGKGDLHNQSRRSLERVFDGYPLVQSIDNVFGTSQYDLLKDSVMVVNWEKIRAKDGKTQEWKNIIMKNGDQTNFREILQNTTNVKRKIILIIDESHSHTNADRGKEIIDLINPSVTIEVSATPILKLSAEDVIEGRGWIEKINPQEVIDEEMIKNQILVNFDFDFKETDDSDEAILRTAINKREELAKLYKENNINVNPLLLIQLPNSTNGEVVKSVVLEQLKNTKGVNLGDDKLSVWLDDENKIDRNLEKISDNTAPQEYLIFKQVIDTGWDCPRAQILLKFRESESEVFNIQVLGRILRMPEQKHYEIEALNKAYVYTNTSSASFDIESYSPKILGDQPAKRSDKYNSINLTSFYKERADYQDIKSDFRKILLDTLINRLDLKQGDSKNNITKLKKIKPSIESELGWEFDTESIFHNVIKDLVLDIQEVDNYKNIFEDDDEDIQLLKINERQIEFISRSFFKSMMAPFTNIARSVPAMNTAWFLSCRELFGEEIINNGTLSSQSFLLLNKNKIKPIFLEAVQVYSLVRSKKAKEDTEHLIQGFEILEKDYFNKAVDEEIREYKKFILQPCYLSKNRSNPEKEFEKYLESLVDVNWWYKNGEMRRDYFGIKYEFQNEVHTFYPDYVVEFSDGRIGIFETKDENDRDKETYTKAKNLALQSFINTENKKNKNHKLFGGVCVFINGEWRINIGKEFVTLVV